MSLKYQLLLAALLVQLWRTHRVNNVCRTLTDYLYPDGNENCYHDPDASLTTPEVILKYARSVEIHEVTSEDGYICTLFRIPRANPKGVILLHHSIATSSRNYLWQSNNSLALNLWHSGFDVWLADQRGALRSDRHVNMTSGEFRYWDFSFHEMGVYDVPAEVELIRSKTNNSKIIYYGNSLGGTMGLVYASVRPTEARDYLKSMILVSPPYIFDEDYGSSVYKILGKFYQYFANLVGIGSAFFLITPLMAACSSTLVRLFPFVLHMIVLFLWIICGYTPDETDPTFLNFDLGVYAADFSLKTLVHFEQVSKSHRPLHMYDYGEDENLKKYGEKKPPAYAINEISIPILLVSGGEDTLITSKSSEVLLDDLPEVARTHGHWKLSGLNHVDFLFGKHRNEIFVHKLLSFLNRLCTTGYTVVLFI